MPCQEGQVVRKNTGFLSHRPKGRTPSKLSSDCMC